MEKIQEAWIKEDVKLVNGVPIKYGIDPNGSKIVQRFAFSNKYSAFLQELLRDPRLKALFGFIGASDCRVGEDEKTDWSSIIT